jgi:type IV pilus assembly protein PilO
MAPLPFLPETWPALEQLKQPFAGLDARDPSQWPAWLRVLLCIAVCLMVMVMLWLAWLGSLDDELMAERNHEQQLRAEYRNKLAQAVGLDALKRQADQVRQDLSRLEGQLPGKAEMDALLSDIHQAGIRRRLQFELFRPGEEVVNTYWVELPITVRVTGHYHEVGLYAADIAKLPRVVILNNLSLTPHRSGLLNLEATVKTFRYRDQDAAAQRKKAAGAQGVGH